MAIAITMLRLSLGMVTASRLAQVSLIRPGRMMTFRFEEGGEGMTDTDRELLEWAAKSVGIKLEINVYGSGNYDAGFWTAYGEIDRHDWNPWDPLKDDGDALRLAIKLGLMIVVWREEKMSYAGNEDSYARNEDWEGIFEKHQDSPAVATRLAIVRAAAAIGRRMA